jgi:hypothetical protein
MLRTPAEKPPRCSTISIGEFGAMGEAGHRLTGSPLTAVLTLMFLSAFLPEVCSGNTPITQFFTPPVFAFLVILGYGVPVLLIRELAVRRHMSIAGILIAGFAYGFYNEGLLAKTMILIGGVPMSSFNNYGDAFGIAIPWALSISLFHAIASVLLPILLTHAIFPNLRDKPWINPWLAFALAALVLSFGALWFMGPFLQHGTPLQLVIFLSMLLGGVAVASRFTKGEEQLVTPPAGVFALLLGLSVILPFLGLTLLAALKVPLLLFVAVWCALLGTYAWAVTSRGWQNPPNILLFGLGLYMAWVLATMIVGVGASKAPVPTFIAGLALEAIFVWAALRIQSLGQRDASERPLEAYHRT